MSIESIVAVDNSTEQCNDTIELETYNQCMKWLEEAKNGFSAWYDRQTKNKQVTAIYCTRNSDSLNSFKQFLEIILFSRY